METATRYATASAELRIPVAMTNPVEDHLHEYSRQNSLAFPIMLQPGMFEGETVALCAPGPSLPDAISGADRVIAVNSAVPHLAGLGVELTMAIAIDQTDGMLRDWAETTDTLYAVASTVDPKLVAHLRSRGHKRKVHFFHNLVGMEGEMDHYREMWPPSFVCGTGATVVDRVIGLMGWLGFRRVDVYGADYAFAEDGTVHANGEDAKAAYGQPLLMRGNIAGKEWITRPDMLHGAVMMARLVAQSGGRIRLMGDGLAVALLGMPDEYLNLVSRELAPGEDPLSEPRHG